MTRPSPIAPNHSEAGYTLTELLVVLVILSLLTAAIAPRIMGRLDGSKIKTAKLQLESVSSAVEVFYLDTGRYPTSDEGLKALITQPENLSAWNGPYVRAPKNLIDPWGNEILLTLDGNGQPVLQTLGADGKKGGEGSAADLIYPDFSTNE